MVYKNININNINIIMLITYLNTVEEVFTGEYGIIHRIGKFISVSVVLLLIVFTES